MEPEFSQIWDLCKNTANNINFHYRPNSEKIMSKFSNTLKNPIFCQFFEQKYFLQKIWPSCAATHGSLTPCWVSKKTNEPIPRKLLDGRMEGQKDRRMEGQKDRRKDRQTLIHRTLLTKAGGPIRSKIYNPSECCLSLHFLWILYFALQLLQHGDI